MRRAPGGVAIVLGLLGVVVVVLVTFLTIRLGVGAGTAVDRMMGGVFSAVFEVDGRVDDLSNRVVLGGEGYGQDVTERTQQVSGSLAQVAATTEALLNTPLVGLLPLDDTRVRSRLAALQTATDELSIRIEELALQMGSASAEVRAPAAEEVDAIAIALSTASDRLLDQVEQLRSDLIRWIALGTVVLSLLWLWAGWGQLALIGWGRRQLRSGGRHSAGWPRS